MNPGSRRGLQAHDSGNQPSTAKTDHWTKTHAIPFVTQWREGIRRALRGAASPLTLDEDAPSSFLQLSAKSQNVWDCKGTRFTIQGPVRELASQRTTIILLAAADSFLCRMHYSILI